MTSNHWMSFFFRLYASELILPLRIQIKKLDFLQSK